MTITDDIPFVRDEIPQIDDSVLRCDVCGVDIVYSGRGRKPTKCEEHKRSSKSTGKRATVKSPSNEKLAADATAVLVQFNDLLTLGMMGAKLHGSASKLANHKEVFEVQAFNALMTDPALCHTILRGGALSGKALLAFAYGSMIMAVAPTLVEEVKERRANAANVNEDIAA